MKIAQLLDCTLRDGGYVNDWEFGHDKIAEIFERLVSSGAEFIEIGFLDERRSFDTNRTIMPDTQSVNKIFSGLNKGNAVIVAMIDYGTCDIMHIQPCAETFLDGIRVIFKEHLMYEALQFCKQLQGLGYKVFAQMVSITTYTDEKLQEYAKIVNSIMPYATSMVDTYGLLNEKKLLHIFHILDTYIDERIKIGFHAHNNFQLAYANGKSFLSADTKHDLLLDGTLYGIGKSAGNAPIELLMMHMNERKEKNYDITQALEAIDNVIMDIYTKQHWGYNMFFYIAASTHCHPNYVSYLMNKKTLSVKQIMDILGNIKISKKLMYDENYAEKIYLDYQNIFCDDRNALSSLKEQFKNHKILLIGPGSNIKHQKRRVKNFIKDNSPLIIAVNYAPSDIEIDAVFLTKSKRYTQLLTDLKKGINNKVNIIATSNVTKTAGYFNYVLNYRSLIDEQTEIIDNSLVMLLKAMIKIGIEKVYLAGFDGYSECSDNYFDTSREYGFVKRKAAYLNNYVKTFLTALADKVNVEFVTKSHYSK
ncbi:aldolase catalytic domain-containing protein [Pectinatus haikarae]